MPLRDEQFSNRQRLHGYLDNVARRDYVLASYFPEENTYDFDFSYELTESGNVPTAEITALDAAAPLTDFDDVKEAFNEVVMIKHGFRINEKRALKYKKPRDERERQGVFDWVYDKIDERVQGVWDMVEYLRAQAAYTGKVEYRAADNDNNIDLRVDFKLDQEKQVSQAAVAWDADGSNPLTDLIAAHKRFKKNNKNTSAQAIHMSEEKYNQIMFHDAVRGQLLGNAADSVQIVTEEQLNRLVQSLKLPPIVVNDQMAYIKGQERPHLADDRVVFLAGNLGSTMIGPSAQRDYEPGIWGNVKYEGDPPQQSMQVGIAAFPALKNKTGIHILEA